MEGTVVDPNSPLRVVVFLFVGLSVLFPLNYKRLFAFRNIALLYILLRMGMGILLFPILVRYDWQEALRTPSIYAYEREILFYFAIAFISLAVGVMTFSHLIKDKEPFSPAGSIRNLFRYFTLDIGGLKGFLIFIWLFCLTSLGAALIFYTFYYTGNTPYCMPEEKYFTSFKDLFIQVRPLYTIGQVLMVVSSSIAIALAFQKHLNFKTRFLFITVVILHLSVLALTIKRGELVRPFTFLAFGLLIGNLPIAKKMFGFITLFLLAIGIAFTFSPSRAILPLHSWVCGSYPEEKRPEEKKLEEKKLERKKLEGKKSQEKRPKVKKLEEKKLKVKKPEEKKPEVRKLERKKPEGEKLEDVVGLIKRSFFDKNTVGKFLTSAIGVQFRETVRVIYGFKKEGEKYLYGRTFLAGILGSFVPTSFSSFKEKFLWGRVTARYFGLTPAMTAGPRVGIVGEAFVNFGIGGVIVFPFLIGLAIAFFDRLHYLFSLEESSSSLLLNALFFYVAGNLTIGFFLDSSNALYSFIREFMVFSVVVGGMVLIQKRVKG